MNRIVVVGGGIGGLAAALALDAAGCAVTVLERAPRFAEIGAGIQLAPNGLAALDRLGVGARVRELAVGVQALRMFDAATDRRLAEVELGEAYRARFGNPYVVVHRGELHRVLFEACCSRPGITLRTDSVVDNYVQDARTVTVRLTSGAALTADAVVGADGVRSAVRAQLLGDGPPVPRGITVYRAAVPMELVDPDLRDPAVTWWVGPGCHLVNYPIAGGTIMNLAASSTGGSTDLSGAPVGPSQVDVALAGLGAGRARRLLEVGTGWRAWALVDRDPAPRWTDGRVTLLGDAAHPMLHYAAQGACLALEDAVVLGRVIGTSPDDLPARLDTYEAARRDRTGAVQLAARDSIRLWHAAGDGARQRDAALAAMTVTDFHDHLDWLHGETDFGLVHAGSATRTDHHA